MGKIASNKPKSGNDDPRPNLWLARLSMYGERKAIRFASDANFERAVRLLWADPELRGMPRDHLGFNTLLVPAEAVELFRQKRLEFEVLPVRSAGDLTPEHANLLLQQHGAH